MAIESQGTLIRRQSTAAGSTGETVAATIAFSSAAKTITRTDGGDFTVDNFATGMRVENNSTLNATSVHTLASVAATVMTVFEPINSVSTGVSITLTGHTMEPIGQVTAFNGPSGSANVIDITNLGSTAKEKIIGIRDEGQVSLDVIWDTNATALQIAMKDDRASRTKRIFDIVLTDALSTNATSQNSALYYNAFVTGLSMTGAVDDVIKATFTQEITSAVIFIDPL